MTSDSWLTVYFISFLKLTFCSVNETNPEVDEQFHTPEGCIPYRDLPKYYNRNLRSPQVQTPKWCAQLLPGNLTTTPETSETFIIKTLQFKLSNYINVTVESIGKDQHIKTIYMAARSINFLTQEFGRLVGRFVPAENTHLVCCNYLDRNAIIIHANGNPSETVRWWPDGDYVGLIVFQATIINEEGKYWANIQSNITIAYY